MTIRTISFVYILQPDCRIRHEHRQLKNQILGFIVQLEIKINAVWYAVVRYDTAHGFAHKDFLHYRGDAEKIPLLLESFNQALTEAERDLRENWEFYRSRFLREVEAYEQNR